MELSAGMAVAQLVLHVGRVVLKIELAADTARQNQKECMYLVTRLSLLSGMLPNLPRDPEVARLLNQLSSTLQDAHDLVVTCQKRGAVKQLLRARHYAERFSQVNARITSDLTLFPLAFYTAAARRRDRIILDSQQSSGAAAPGSSSSGSGKTPMGVSHASDDQPRQLTWAEIAAATNNLAVELGGGRSGTVYKGSLHNHGQAREVAVKVLKHGRQRMEVSFVAELEILFPLRHVHIARLVGWCAEKERRMFVYEHMSNGTLRDHLLGERGGSPVATSWRARLEVLLGAARALQHLHRSTAPPVIHRNVSSSNILLDASWTSRLSDFGQALWQKADEHGGQGQLVPEAIGTFGYIDPEYDDKRSVSPASDVYSFGVVILEVLTGRPHMHMSSSTSKGKLAEFPVTLVSTVLPVIKAGKLRDVLDGRPELPTPGQMEALELVAHTAERCLWKHGKDRPAMSNVVANLETALGIISSDEANLYCLIRGDA